MLKKTLQLFTTKSTKFFQSTKPIVGLTGKAEIEKEIESNGVKKEAVEREQLYYGGHKVFLEKKEEKSSVKLNPESSNCKGKVVEEEQIYYGGCTVRIKK